MIPTFTQKCYVCGGRNYQIGSPTVLVDINDQENEFTWLSCAAVQEAGISGVIPPEACAYTTQQVIFRCNCRPSSNDMGSDTPTVVPFVPSICSLCAPNDTATTNSTTTNTTTTTNNSTSHNNHTNITLYISEQWNVIQLMNEVMTCGALELAAQAGVLYETSYCQAAQQIVAEGQCGVCTDQTVAPNPSPLLWNDNIGVTFSPTITSSPTRTASPTYVDKCTFCNEDSGYDPALHEIIVLNGQVYSCYEIEVNGLKGFMDSTSCQFIQRQIATVNENNNLLNQTNPNNNGNTSTNSTNSTNTSTASNNMNNNMNNNTTNTTKQQQQQQPQYGCTCRSKNEFIMSSDVPSLTISDIETNLPTSSRNITTIVPTNTRVITIPTIVPPSPTIPTSSSSKSPWVNRNNNILFGITTILLLLLTNSIFLIFVM
jgi:hypothetical protein